MSTFQSQLPIVVAIIALLALQHQRNQSSAPMMDRYFNNVYINAYNNRNIYILSFISDLTPFSIIHSSLAELFLKSSFFAKLYWKNVLQKELLLGSHQGEDASNFTAVSHWKLEFSSPWILFQKGWNEIFKWFCKINFVKLLRNILHWLRSEHFQFQSLFSVDIGSSLALIEPLHNLK